MIRTVFGLDVSKATSNIAVVVNQQPIDEFKITNDRIGFNELLQELHKVSSPEIVFEATGVYSVRLKRFLDSQNLPYTQLNPLEAKKQLDSLRHDKNDKKDALGLAQTHFLIKRALYYAQKPVYFELKQRSNHYQELVSDVARDKNRLHRYLQLAFPELESLYSSTEGPLYWTTVQRFPHPDIVRNTSVKEIKEIIRKAARTVGPIKREGYVKKLITIAKSAFPAVDKDSDVVSRIQQLATDLAQMFQEKKRVIKGMIKIAKDLPELALFKSIPGIGQTTAIELISELGDIRRFRKDSQLCAFVGIDLREFQSGKFEAGKHISKRGNPIARKLLYKAVLNIASAARFHPNHINDYYRRIKKQFSKPSTKRIVMGAIQRLLRTMYHLVRFNQPYNYTLAKKR